MEAILRHFTTGDNALLVRRGHHFVGIVTKFDVLHYLTDGGASRAKP